MDVDPKAIATFIDPENVSYRVSSLFPRKVALMTSTIPVVLTTNAGGNCAIVIRPYSDNVFYTTYTGVDYIPSTGAGTGIASDGPTDVANVSSYRTTGFAVNVITLANNNSNGSVYMSLVESSPSILPLSSMAS